MPTPSWAPPLLRPTSPARSPRSGHKDDFRCPVVSARNYQRVTLGKPGRPPGKLQSGRGALSRLAGRAGGAGPRKGFAIIKVLGPRAPAQPRPAGHSGPLAARRHPGGQPPASWRAALPQVRAPVRGKARSSQAGGPRALPPAPQPPHPKGLAEQVCPGPLRARLSVPFPSSPRTNSHHSGSVSAGQRRWQRKTPAARFQTLPQPCPPLRPVSTCRGRKKTTRDAPRRRPGTPAGSAPSKLTRRVRTARPFLSFLSLPCAPPTKSGETGKRPDEASGHLGLCVLESCLAAALETQRRLRPRDSGRSGLDERRLNPHSRVPPPVPQASTHPARRAHSSPKPRSAGDSSSFLTPSQRSSSASRSPAPRFFRGALAAPGPPGPRAHGGALAAEDRLGIPSDGLAAVGGLARGATRKLSAQVCCALEEKAFPYKAQRRNAQAEP